MGFICDAPTFICGILNISAKLGLYAFNFSSSKLHCIGSVDKVIADN